MDANEILYDHYKESFSLSKEAQSRRNKSFVIICILEAVSFFVVISPATALEIIKKNIESKFDILFPSGNAILQTLLWILIVYATIRYVQDTMYIERQYSYLEKLEKQIAKIENCNIFDRESTNYSTNYPSVLNLIDLFYKMFSPILFFSINVFRIIQEWKIQDIISLSLICDTILCVSLLIIIWFYFFGIHNKITKWCKTHIPLLKRLDDRLQKLLKEV